MLMVDITKSWEVCYESIDFLYTSWQFWRNHCCHQAREDAETAVRELDHRRVLLACLPDGSKPWWPKTNKNSCEIDVHPQSIWSHTFLFHFNTPKHACIMGIYGDYRNIEYLWIPKSINVRGCTNIHTPIRYRQVQGSNLRLRAYHGDGPGAIWVRSVYEAKRSQAECRELMGTEGTDRNRLEFQAADNYLGTTLEL